MVEQKLSRLAFLLPAIASLIIGVVTGLSRTSIDIFNTLSPLGGLHSIFMISGFFGTVISLERAVAIQKKWPYFASVFSALGGLALTSTMTAPFSPVLLCAASAIFCCSNAVVALRHPALHTRLLLVAALLWLLGNLSWLIFDSAWVSIPYGLSFLVLTIAAERLELTRFLPTPISAKWVFIVLTGLTLLGTGVSATTIFFDNRLLGSSYALLSIWLIRFDIAKKTISQKGVTRFVAVCLLSGYFWLLVGGLLLSNLFDIGPFQRDAGIHGIALGFIFSMVIGHAPVIFPAVLRASIPYSPFFYIPWTLIQVGTATRFAAAALSNPVYRSVGAVISALAIVSFFFIMARQAIRGARK